MTQLYYKARAMYTALPRVNRVVLVELVACLLSVTLFFVSLLPFAFLSILAAMAYVSFRYIRVEQKLATIAAMTREEK